MGALSVVALCARADSAHAAQPVIWTLTTPNPQANASFSVTSMADLDGDARADIIVGAGGETVGANAAQGRAYAFSGATGALIRTFNTENPQANGFFGFRVFANADIDGDTRPEVIVGAPYEAVGTNSEQGRVYVFNGATGAHIRTLTTPNPQEDAHFGGAIAAGDMDDDGLAEVVVGAQDEDVGLNTVQGRVYVFAGATGTLMTTLDSPNPETSGTFGNTVAVALVNADSAHDIVVGASGETVSDVSEQGRAYLFEGVSWTLLHTFVSPNPQEFSGCCGLAVGDVDGDARADIAMSAIHEDVTVGMNTFTGLGRVYVFNGATYALMKTLTTPNPESGLIFGFGTWISMGAIVHAGRSDIVVGSIFETVDGDGASGRAYVFGGQTGALMYSIESPNAQASGLFGYVPTGPFGDVNFDQKADIAIGAFGETADLNAGQGRVYVISGANADDLDGDGCSAIEEGGGNPALGGLRNAANEWDFYDVNGTRKVDSQDIGLVRARFNGGGPTPAENKIYDRSAGPHLWAPGPPDNMIGAVDIALVRSSFNHSCIAAP